LTKIGAKFGLGSIRPNFAGAGVSFDAPLFHNQEVGELVLTNFTQFLAIQNCFFFKKNFYLLNQLKQCDWMLKFWSIYTMSKIKKGRDETQTRDLY